jgi:hypothetical protein
MNHPVLDSLVDMVHQPAQVLDSLVAMVHQPISVLVIAVELLVEVLSALVAHPMSQLHQVLKYNNDGQLMLKVSTLTTTHKSSENQLLVVFKHTHKTFESDSFNHHQYHPQAHSSSKKYAHLNHLHHHHSALDNKLHLFLNHHHSFFVKDHQYHQPQLLLKLSSVN